MPKVGVNYRKEVYLTIIAVVCSLFVSSIAFAGGPSGGGGSNPPPTCATIAPGCYTTEDKLASGPIGRGMFSHYYPDRVCVATGSCSCPDSTSLRRSDAITDQNSDAGACACTQGAQYDANAGCCGDHEDDCGKVSNGILCSLNSNLLTDGWFESGAYEGAIVYVGCPAIQTEFLSTGSTWVKCAEDIERQTVNGNEFLCTGRPGREAWVECCGDNQCNSVNDGRRLVTGDNVNLEEPYWRAAPYEDCSASCGGGTQTRAVECSTFDFDTNVRTVVADSECSDTKPSTSRTCNTHVCPVNGRWSSWGAYGTCTNGIKTRTCSCTNPAPSNGGANCVGEASQSVSCESPQDCRVNSEGDTECNNRNNDDFGGGAPDPDPDPSNPEQSQGDDDDDPDDISLVE